MSETNNPPVEKQGILKSIHLKLIGIIFIIANIRLVKGFDPLDWIWDFFTEQVLGAIYNVINQIVGWFVKLTTYFIRVNPHVWPLDAATIGDLPREYIYISYVSVVQLNLMKMFHVWYIIAIIFIGIYLIFMNASPHGRSRAKDSLIRLLVGMVIVSNSPAIFQWLMWMANYLMTGILDAAIDADPNLDIFDSLWIIITAPTQALKLFCLFLCYGVTIMFASLVATLRFFIMTFLAAIFPLTLFLYFFDLQIPILNEFISFKGMGTALFKFTILVILAQIWMVFFLAVAIILIKNPTSGPLGLTMDLLLLMVAFGGIVFAPLMSMQLLSWVGAVGHVYSSRPTMVGTRFAANLMMSQSLSNAINRGSMQWYVGHNLGEYAGGASEGAGASQRAFAFGTIGGGPLAKESMSSGEDFLTKGGYSAGGGPGTGGFGRVQGAGNQMGGDPPSSPVIPSAPQRGSSAPSRVFPSQAPQSAPADSGSSDDVQPSFTPPPASRASSSPDSQIHTPAGSTLLPKVDTQGKSVPLGPSERDVDVRSRSENRTNLFTEGGNQTETVPDHVDMDAGSSSGKSSSTSGKVAGGLAAKPPTPAGAHDASSPDSGSAPKGGTKFKSESKSPVSESPVDGRTPAHEASPVSVPERGLMSGGSGAPRGLGTSLGGPPASTSFAEPPQKAAATQANGKQKKKEKPTRDGASVKKTGTKKHGETGKTISTPKNTVPTKGQGDREALIDYEQTNKQAEEERIRENKLADQNLMSERIKSARKKSAVNTQHASELAAYTKKQLGTPPTPAVPSRKTNDNRTIVGRDQIGKDGKRTGETVTQAPPKPGKTIIDQKGAPVSDSSPIRRKKRLATMVSNDADFVPNQNLNSVKYSETVEGLAKQYPDSKKLEVELRKKSKTVKEYKTTGDIQQRNPKLHSKLEKQVVQELGGTEDPKSIDSNPELKIQKEQLVLNYANSPKQEQYMNAGKTVLNDVKTKQKELGIKSTDTPVARPKKGLKDLSQVKPQEKAKVLTEINEAKKKANKGDVYATSRLANRLKKEYDMTPPDGLKGDTDGQVFKEFEDNAGKKRKQLNVTPPESEKQKLSHVFGDKSPTITTILETHGDKFKTLPALVGARVEKGMGDTGERQTEKLSKELKIPKEDIRVSAVASSYLKTKEKENGPLLHYRVIPDSHLDNILEDKALLSGDKLKEKHPEVGDNVGGDIFMTRDGYNKTGRLTNDGLGMLTSGSQVATSGRDLIFVFDEKVYNSEGYRPKANASNYPTAKEIPIENVKCIISPDGSQIPSITQRLQKNGLDIPIETLDSYKRQNYSTPGIAKEKVEKKTTTPEKQTTSATRSQPSPAPASSSSPLAALNNRIDDLRQNEIEFSSMQAKKHIATPQVQRIFIDGMRDVHGKEGATNRMVDVATQFKTFALSAQKEKGVSFESAWNYSINKNAKNILTSQETASIQKHIADDSAQQVKASERPGQLKGSINQTLEGSTNYTLRQIFGENLENIPAQPPRSDTKPIGTPKKTGGTKTVDIPDNSKTGEKKSTKPSETNEPDEKK